MTGGIDPPPAAAPPATMRRATPEDAGAIAALHVTAWQWAYRGLLPDALLDRLTETLDRRTERYQSVLTDEPPEQRTWVAEDASGIVGFAITCPSRDPDAPPATSEVAAIYLDPEVVGTGVGRALFAHAVDDLRQRGYTRAILWVLETNHRGRRFYEVAGWTTDGATKTEDWPGAPVQELRYQANL